MDVWQSVEADQICFVGWNLREVPSSLLLNSCMCEYVEAAEHMVIKWSALGVQGGWDKIKEQLLTGVGCLEGRGSPTLTDRVGGG